MGATNTPSQGFIMSTIKNTIGAAALSLGLAGSVFALAGWTGNETQTASVMTAENTAGTRAYEVDNTHSSVNFMIVHAQVANFYGRFNDFKGSINLDEDDFANSTIEFEVSIKSIDTNSRTRDGHLRDVDFFNSRQFRNATFASSSIAEKSDGVYEVTGELDLRGVTKTITATMTDLRMGSFNGEDKLGAEVRFSIKRGDFEINKYLAAGGGEDGPLSNTVELVISIEAIGQ